MIYTWHNFSNEKLDLVLYVLQKIAEKVSCIMMALIDVSTFGWHLIESITYLSVRNSVMRNLNYKVSYFSKPNVLLLWFLLVCSITRFGPQCSICSIFSSWCFPVPVKALERDYQAVLLIFTQS